MTKYASIKTTAYHCLPRPCSVLRRATTPRSGECIAELVNVSRRFHDVLLTISKMSHVRTASSFKLSVRRRVGPPTRMEEAQLLRFIAGNVKHLMVVSECVYHGRGSQIDSERLRCRITQQIQPLYMHNFRRNLFLSGRKSSLEP